jgi:hypothetical protein
MVLLGHDVDVSFPDDLAFAELSVDSNAGNVVVDGFYGDTINVWSRPRGSRAPRASFWGPRSILHAKEAFSIAARILLGPKN